MAWVEPLDLQTNLINTLSGSNDIFIGLALVFLSGFAAYFKFENRDTLLLLGLFFIVMSPWFGNVYVIPIIVIAMLLAYFGISRIVKN